MTDLYRTEHYCIALSKGDLSEGANRDIVIAGGWSSRYNQLGHLVVSFENTIDRKARTFCKRKRADLMGFLIAQLATTGTYIDDAREIADQAVNWRTDHWCRFCNGTGVINAEQQPCPICAGTGEMLKPVMAERVLAEISAAVDYWERQLQARMAGWEKIRPGAKRTFSVLASEFGTYTPPAAPGE